MHDGCMTTDDSFACIICLCFRAKQPKQPSGELDAGAGANRIRLCTGKESCLCPMLCYTSEKSLY